MRVSQKVVEGRAVRQHERQQIIWREARRNGTVRIAELADRLGVSGETIRRDLDDLADAGRLRRIYGGAALPSGAAGAPDRIAAAALERMAAAVTAGIEPGQAVMISGGAPALHVARRLAQGVAGVTVITNSLGIVAAAGPEVEVVLCPGTHDSKLGSVHGEDTLAYLARFHADLAVIAGCALSPNGASDARRGSANVKRAMLAQTTRGILMLEPPQLGCVALQAVAPVSAFTEIVTSGKPPAPIAAACRRAGVTLTVV